ncbi:MAG: protein phosphatase CheZ [Gammaproteobacteria bacterium]|nr:protein phosphatase CheZ [Gammaproteobacteria bacterium]
MSNQTAESTEVDPIFIDKARQLVKHLEDDNEVEANRLLHELSSEYSSNLFSELGKLTREFHDALNSFRHDAQISQLSEDEFVDARDRLNYVITMTQNAADRTLTAVEKSVPLCDQLEERGEMVARKWKRFMARDMSATEFRELAREIGDFLELNHTDATQLKVHLNDVLMAQDYQDLTGQIIRRVIELVQSVEDSLVDLIKISGRDMSEPANDTKKESNTLEGPQIAGKESSTAVTSQDDVDDLLSSLGF